jgi:hydroxylysine kinase
MQAQDPLAVIAQEAPHIPDEEAIAIAKQRYGLVVTAKSLVSERDQNFRMRAVDGKRYVLKIANSAEDPVVTDFQVQALLHIEQRVREEGLPVAAPEIVRTLDGAVSFLLPIDGVDHVVRLVTFIEGRPLADETPSPALARDAGRCLAHLGRALRGFEHPGSSQSLLWDLQQALGLRELIEYVRDPVVADAVGAALADFEEFAAPVLPSLRAQVIHSDLNPDNLVVCEGDPDKVAGVIDFGDMLHAPLVADVAIGCSYQRPDSGNPLGLMSEFLAGYHSVTPLEQREIDILFDLVQARICASVTILDWRASVRGTDDPYLAGLENSEQSTGKFLVGLREIPREHAISVFRQVCASVDGERQLLS